MFFINITPHLFSAFAREVPQLAEKKTPHLTDVGGIGL
jgi:hypothetical protein